MADTDRFGAIEAGLTPRTPQSHRQDTPQGSARGPWLSVFSRSPSRVPQAEQQQQREQLLPQNNARGAAAGQGDPMGLQAHGTPSFVEMERMLASLPDRVRRGVLSVLGVAIGDSAGLPYELWSHRDNRDNAASEAIRGRSDEVGPRYLFHYTLELILRNLGSRGSDNVYARTYSDDSACTCLKMAAIVQYDRHTKCGFMQSWIRAQLRQQQGTPSGASHDEGTATAALDVPRLGGRPALQSHIWACYVSQLISWSQNASGRLFQGTGGFTKDLMSGREKSRRREYGRDERPKCLDISPEVGKHWSRGDETWAEEWFLRHCENTCNGSGGNYGGSYGNGAVMCMAPQVIADIMWWEKFESEVLVSVCPKPNCKYRNKLEDSDQITCEECGHRYTFSEEEENHVDMEVDAAMGLNFGCAVLGLRPGPGTHSLDSGKALMDTHRFHSAQRGAWLLHDVERLTICGYVKSSDKLREEVLNSEAWQEIMAEPLLRGHRAHPIEAFNKFLSTGDCDDGDVDSFVTNFVDRPYWQMQKEPEIHAGWSGNLLGKKFGQLLKTCANWDDNHANGREDRLKMNGAEIRFSQQGLNSVIIAIWVACCSECPADWMGRLFYVGGDTDTIGSVCGQIACPLMPVEEVCQAYRHFVALDSCKYMEPSAMVANAAAHRFFYRALLFNSGRWDELAQMPRLCDPVYPGLTDLAGTRVLPRVLWVDRACRRNAANLSLDEQARREYVESNDAKTFLRITNEPDIEKAAPQLYAMAAGNGDCFDVVVSDNVAMLRTLREYWQYNEAERPFFCYLAAGGRSAEAAQVRIHRWAHAMEPPYYEDRIKIRRVLLGATYRRRPTRAGVAPEEGSYALAGINTAMARSRVAGV